MTFIKRTAVALSALALAACVDPSVLLGGGSSTDQQPVAVSKEGLTKEQLAAVANYKARGQKLSTDVLTQRFAAEANPYVRNEIALALANKLTAENKLDAAKYYLQQYQTSSDPDQQNRWGLIANKLAQLLNDPSLAAGSSFDPTAVKIDERLNAAKVAILADIRDNKPDNAVATANAVYSSLKGADRLDLVNFTLDHLQSFSANRLDSLAQLAGQRGDGLAVGWYRLAQIATTHKGDVANLNSHWQAWLSAFSRINHPAAQTQPTMFDQTARVAAANFNQVGVILPFGNPGVRLYADALRAGIDAANAETGNRVSVSYYDSFAEGKLPEAYKAALQGNNLLIGPYLRDNVNEASGYNLELPILMLNNPTTNNLQACYFNIRIEDEAETIARVLAAKKTNNVYLLSDGSTSAKRAIARFQELWPNLSGENVIIEEINQKNISDTARKLLNNRPAPGAVVFLGNYLGLNAFQNALSYIRPTHNLVTYATSIAIHQSTSRSKLGEYRNVYFTDSALIGNQESQSSKAALGNDIVRGNYNGARLYGLGYDAFKVAQSYAALRNVNNFNVQGITGQIYREQNSCVLHVNYNLFQVVNGNFVRVN